MSTTDPLREALERIASFVATSDRHAALSLPHLQAWAREALAAVPSEPKAWEWQAGGGASGYQPVGPEGTADRARQTYEWFARCPATWVERRRPGTAPGPWERVDPESREDEGT